MNVKMREIKSSIWYLENLNTDEHPMLNKVGVDVYLDHVQHLLREVERYKEVLDSVESDIDDILYDFHRQ